ncbi:MAG: hypothetical protein JXC36_06395 [Candidatus Atribacteria bacterium]|nr:hypothetical protein [Candidatus Atribacteria bacterium]
MNKVKIAYFDTKPYDKKTFEFVNQNYNYSISFFDSRLTEQTVSLAKGFDVVCAFLNDTLNTEGIGNLTQNGTRPITMRCTGYNNVEVDAGHYRRKTSQKTT